MARVLRTRLARDDLKQIGAHFATESQSEVVALKFLDTVAVKADLYAATPHLGELCSDLGPNIRRFMVGNYVAFIGR